MKLFHYTCRHSLSGLKLDGRLLPHAHPLMPDTEPMVHLTDLDYPMRDALGLTSRIIRCDRTEFRVVVETDAAVHWPVFARTIPRSARVELESAEGARPIHWYIATVPVPIVCWEPVGGRPAEQYRRPR